MTVIKLPRLHKTLAIALTVMGVYTNTPSANSSTLVPAASALPEVSSLQRTRLSTSQRFTLNQTIAQNSEPIPPDEGAPGRRQSAGSRSPLCPKVDLPLTALVPITSGAVSGVTAQERPTLWFYVPYELTAETPIQFVLQDDDNHNLYQSSLIKSGNTPGVVGIKLPPSAPALEAGKRYYWYFLVFCGDQDAPALVEGWVERVALNSALKSKLEQATPRERVALYTDNNFWFDAMTALATLRRENPTDAALEEQWNQMLKSVDLEMLAPAPITSVLTPQE